MINSQNYYVLLRETENAKNMKNIHLKKKITEYVQRNIHPSFVTMTPPSNDIILCRDQIIEIACLALFRSFQTLYYYCRIVTTHLNHIVFTFEAIKQARFYFDWKSCTIYPYGFSNRFPFCKNDAIKLYRDCL